MLEPLLIGFSSWLVVEVLCLLIVWLLVFVIWLWPELLDVLLEVVTLLLVFVPLDVLPWLDVLPVLEGAVSP